MVTGAAMSDLDHLRAHVAALVQALEFYADPHTYFAWAFLSDPPCGDWGDDFEATEPEPYPQVKPGKRARAVLDAPDLAALVAREQARDAVIAAARSEHEGTCPRRPRPEEGFLGACRICARLADLDAVLAGRIDGPGG